MLLIFLSIMDFSGLEVTGHGINLWTGSTNRRRNKGLVVRSAPMTRCIGEQPARSSAVRRTTKSSKDTKSLSVDDVYHLAEKERIRSSYRNRRHVLEKAQKDVRHDEVFSRPHSSVSRFLSQSLSTGGDKSRLSSAHSTLKPNTPDASEFASVNHCCEIMGPSICQTCRKANSRESNMIRADATFPSLRVTQQNITTSAIVKRLYPDMSNSDIHNKIARGEIARSYFPKALQVKPPKDDELSREDKLKHNEKTVYTIARMKQRFKNKGAPTTPMYFHNIRDLNFKIMSGKVPRELGFDKLVPHFAGEKDIDELEQSSASSLFPIFVSPRKVTLYKEPAYKSYFAPPLLPRASQKPEPSFFAGSNFEYKLPERLPDKLVFVEGVKSRADSASAGSVVSNDTLEEDSVPAGPVGD